MTPTISEAESTCPSPSSPSLATLTHLPATLPIIASTLCLPLESTYLIHAPPPTSPHGPTTVCDLQGHPIFHFGPLRRNRSGRMNTSMNHAALPESPLLTIRKSIDIVPWFSSSSTYLVFPGGRPRCGSSWSSLSSVDRRSRHEEASMKVMVHRPKAPWRKDISVTAVLPHLDVTLYVPTPVSRDGEFEVMMLVHGEAKSLPVARVNRCGGGENRDEQKHRQSEGRTHVVDVANGLDIGAVCALVVIANVYARR